VSLIAVTSLLATLATGSPFWEGLSPGPYRVGFEERELVDDSRPFRADGEGRSLPALVWYPALDVADAVPVPLERYVGASGRDAFASRLRLYGPSLTPSEIEAVLSAPTNAYEAAPAAPGRFPLLLFSSGLTAPGYLHVVLCEYLASHGYVAVAIPSLPPRDGLEAAYDQRMVDAQMRDLELVIQELRDDPRVDVRRLGLAAWSLGGVAQALVQMQNPNVVAVVSLDAATGYAYGEELLEGSLFFEPSRATAAFFHATDSREDTSPAAKSFRYFDDVVAGRAYLLTLEGIAHSEMTSFGSVIPHAVIRREGSGAVLERHRLLCLYVERFLDEAFAKDAEASDFLSVAPTRHGFDGLVLTRKR
jgi:dienelactone hydrolase